MCATLEVVQTPEIFKALTSLVNFISDGFLGHSNSCNHSIALSIKIKVATSSQLLLNHFIVWTLLVWHWHMLWPPSVIPCSMQMQWTMGFQWIQSWQCHKHPNLIFKLHNHVDRWWQHCSHAATNWVAIPKFSLPRITGHVFPQNDSAHLHLHQCTVCHKCTTAFTMRNCTNHGLNFIYFLCRC